MILKLQAIRQCKISTKEKAIFYLQINLTQKLRKNPSFLTKITHF